MRTIERMVDQEIICNVSSLIATMAEGYGAAIDTGRHGTLQPTIEQAFELCSPIQDWESAAMEGGWSYDAKDRRYEHVSGRFMCLGKGSDVSFESLCELEGIDPHEREIFEHWFVTPWLAERLEAKGERIDRDFAGHCVWGRTTTGQGPANDSVIEEVYADAKREYGELFPCS